MPNVRVQGAYCIMKISTLYIGVKELLKNQILDKLLNLENKTTDEKKYFVMALLNVKM